MFEFREIKSETEYKTLELRPDAPFTQSWFFGEWQEAMGRKVERFEIKKNSETIGFFQMIKYSLPLSKNILYIPHGPILKTTSGGAQMTIPYNEFLKKFRNKLLEIARKKNAIFARFDFYSRNSDYESRNLDEYFKKVPYYAYHSSYFQPKYEWITDLNKTEEEMLGDMHPKARYNIRLAEKRGVIVEIIKQDFEKYFNDFYRLLKETARCDNFNLHPKAYYEDIFVNCEKNKNAFLAIANYNGKILAINLVLLYGDIAYFIFGASSDEFKNLMAPHLLHWKVIMEVKKIGLKIYNFGAVGEEYEGISRFKKRFGGELLEYSDSYDLILKPFCYYLYNLRKRFW